MKDNNSWKDKHMREKWRKESLTRCERMTLLNVTLNPTTMLFEMKELIKIALLLLLLPFSYRLSKYLPSFLPSVCVRGRMNEWIEGTLLTLKIWDWGSVEPCSFVFCTWSRWKREKTRRKGKGGEKRTLEIVGSGWVTLCWKRGEKGRIRKRAVVK